MAERQRGTVVRTSLSLLGVLALAVSFTVAWAVEPTTRIDPIVTADDWPGFGGDGSEQHYSSIDQISVANVSRLGLAWHYELESGFTVSAPVEAAGESIDLYGHPE